MRSRSTSHAIAFDEDERVRRRDLACIASGAATGGGLGLLAGAFARPNGVLLAVVGALIGGLGGRLLAFYISPEEWDPPPTHHAYVGANSPDDDIAGG